MSPIHFFVNIVCLLNINCYFCRSLLSSEESKFLIILLRTVIYYILYKNPLIFNFCEWNKWQVSRTFVYITLLYTHLGVGLSLMFTKGVVVDTLYRAWVDSFHVLFIYKPSHLWEQMRQTKLYRWVMILKRTSSAWCNTLSCISP